MPCSNIYNMKRSTNDHTVKVDEILSGQETILINVISRNPVLLLISTLYTYTPLDIRELHSSYSQTDCRYGTAKYQPLIQSMLMRLSGLALEIRLSSHNVLAQNRPCSGRTIA